MNKKLVVGEVTQPNFTSILLDTCPKWEKCHVHFFRKRKRSARMPSRLTLETGLPIPRRMDRTGATRFDSGKVGFQDFHESQKCASLHLDPATCSYTQSYPKLMSRVGKRTITRPKSDFSKQAVDVTKSAISSNFVGSTAQEF